MNQPMSYACLTHKLGINKKQDFIFYNNRLVHCIGNYGIYCIEYNHNSSFSVEKYVKLGVTTESNDLYISQELYIKLKNEADANKNYVSLQPKFNELWLKLVPKAKKYGYDTSFVNSIIQAQRSFVFSRLQG